MKLTNFKCEQSYYITSKYCHEESKMIGFIKIPIINSSSLSIFVYWNAPIESNYLLEPRPNLSSVLTSLSRAFGYGVQDLP